MSLFRRMSQVFQQKANSALNKVENPNEALDLSYEKMLENLQQVRRSIADVLTSQKRLEAQRANLKAQYDKLQGQARQALQQGQEDLAKTAITRSQSIETQMTALDPQIAQLQTQEQALEGTAQKLQAKLELFRSQRETMKAQYTAAKASTDAMENLTGLSEHMADVTLMMDRAQEKITQAQARSAAVSELADSGILDQTAIGGPKDDIEAALSAGTLKSNVDLQLEQLKADMGLTAGNAPESQASISAAPTSQTAPTAAGSSTNVAPIEGESTDSLVVRVAGESRYRVPANIKPALDGLDVAMEMAINSGDAAGLAKCSEQLQKLLVSSGVVLDDSDLTPSDIIVPSPDMSISEAKTLLAKE